PLSYGPEFVEQFRFVLAVAWFPMVLTSFAIAFGPFGIQGSDFLGLFGALDRLGGLYGTFVPREFGPLVVAIVVAGTAGTAICAAGSTVELAASHVKCLVFGGMIAIVCCYKGLTASGGAEGVGRAVNRAVVMAFLGIGAIDYVFTQLILATHPVLSQVR